jgi:hypothetical protein
MSSVLIFIEISERPTVFQIRDAPALAGWQRICLV